jgi:hypothetical protein
MTSVTLRICRLEDERALRRLATRDSAAPLAGTVLLAEVEGEPRAAIALESRRVVADPFARADQLAQPSRPPLGPGRVRRHLRAWLPRPARETAH